MSEEKKTEWELLAESPRTEVNRLIEFYKKDKAKAKVIYHQDKKKYTYNRVIIFKKGKKNFEIVNFLVTYGISVNAIMYHRQKMTASIIYKDNKFWSTGDFRGQKKFTQLCYQGLHNFIHCLNITGDERNMILKSLEDKFTWLRWVRENQNIYHVCFNTILRYDLRNYNDVIRHKYGVPINIARIIQTGNGQHDEIGMHKIWKEMKKVLLGVQNLTPELFKNEYFIDTCKMAGALGRKVNCSWGLKRLKEEHDNWSKEITRTILEYAVLQKLNVGKIYMAFAMYSGYHIFRTNKEMIVEGKKQRHCVATYIDRVDSGSCGIYHVNGYTLELRRSSQYLRNDMGIMTNTNKQILQIIQFKGLDNKNAPTELTAEVQVKLDEFNLLETFEEYLVNIPEIVLDYELTDNDIEGSRVPLFVGENNMARVDNDDWI